MSAGPCLSCRELKPSAIALLATGPRKLPPPCPRSKITPRRRASIMHGSSFPVKRLTSSSCNIHYDWSPFVGNTTLRGLPLRKLLMLSIASASPASSTSGVTPAQCGVNTTLSSLVSGCPGGSGSTSNTSSPAPAMRRVRNASIRAASSTIGPRAVFTRIADRFHHLELSAAEESVVSGDSRKCRLTTSLARNNSSSSTSSKPSAGLGCIVQAITLIPMP